MIRVIVADDHTVVRRGVIQILAEASDIVVVGEASSGRGTLRLVQHVPCDVLLLDIAMPEGSGLEVLDQVRGMNPTLRVVVLSIYPERQYAIRALRAGAAGYLTKDSTPDELIAAVRCVCAGDRYVSSTLAAALAESVGAPADQLLHHQLSDREDQVMRLLAGGQTVSEIAEDLALSVKTISTYRVRILEKLHLKTNADIMRYAFEHHLID
jgi:two-component system, NarL family, invasion response regulator UvrY